MQSLRVTAAAAFWTADDSTARVGLGGGRPLVLAKGRAHPTALDVAGGCGRHAVWLARRGLDVDGFQGYSALAPEIFTARARFSLSFFMYAANSSGELPTTS